MFARPPTSRNDRVAGTRFHCAGSTYALVSCGTVGTLAWACGWPREGTAISHLERDQGLGQGPPAVAAACRDVHAAFPTDCTAVPFPRLGQADATSIGQRGVEGLGWGQAIEIRHGRGCAVSPRLRTTMGKPAGGGDVADACRSDELGVRLTEPPRAVSRSSKLRASRCAVSTPSLPGHAGRAGATATRRG